MGKHEVTQEQYQKIMGSNPSYFQGSNSYTDSSKQPVEMVSWNDAVSFCNKLSINQGLTPCYTDSGGSTIIDSGDIVSCNWSANGYRLPTEAEWEYCCRAGTTTKYSWGDSTDDSTVKNYAWYEDNADDDYWSTPHADKPGTQPAGTKTANPWGLDDMHGNVTEWCWDWCEWDYYSEGENSDPRGPDSGSYRAQRGSCWYDDASYLRSAYRTSLTPTFTSRNLGFRILRLQNSSSVSLPASPSSLFAIASDSSVTLTWDSVSGANFYNIYYSTSSGVTKNNGTKLSGKMSPFVHSGLTNGTAYHYVVTAVNSAGESEVSVEKSGIPSSAGSNEIDLGDGVKMNFVAINAGSFTMGDADGYSWERPTRMVSIGNSFYMGKHEVTQAQYQKIMGTNPSNFTTDDNLPVELVSWYDAVSFCNRLSTDQGLTPCYTDSSGSNIIDSGDTVNCNWSANGYRLPTEAEWEFCCRAGTTTDHSCGDTFDGAYGWYYENSFAATHIVGTKLPNPWGLYDMHGNVAEWCWDWFGEDYYSQGENSDPRGPSGGLGRVFRGGGFGVGALALRSAYRIRTIEWVGYTWAAQDTGFRVLRCGLPLSPVRQKYG